LIKTGKLY